MGKKFVIIVPDVAETEYCRAVCKLIDNTLVDDDFDLVAGITTTMDLAVDYYVEQYGGYSQKPILILPYNLVGSGGRSSLAQSYGVYPDVPIVTAFYPSGALPSLPAALSLDPNRLSHLVLVSGGVSGLSDWFTGAGLEFVEEAPVQYLSGGSNVTSFAVTNVTDQGGGVARISSTGIHFYALNNMLIHIAGVSGFANDINGKRTVVGKGTGYVDVTFTLGAGTFSGPSANAKFQWVSGAMSVVAAKLGKIMRERDCGFWEARYCGRETGSEDGVHGNTTGYGSIDVDAAISFADSVPDDPYDTLGSIGTLSISVVDGAATFTHPEIVNAKQVTLFKGSTALRSFASETDTLIGSTMLGRELGYVYYPVELGNHNYKMVGYRGSQVTSDSNTVNTNIQSLEDKPAEPIYPIGLTVYYWRGAQLMSSDIDNITQVVTNPENNNVGIETTKYTLTNGETVTENNLFASRRHAQAHLLLDYLNVIAPIGINTYEAREDMCGQDFRGTDFTYDSNDYDFTNAIVANSNFEGATMPAAYTGEGGLEDWLDVLAYCDKASTIWITGNTVEEELGE